MAVLVNLVISTFVIEAFLCAQSPLSSIRYIAIILLGWMDVNADLKHEGRMCHSNGFVLMSFVSLPWSQNYNGRF